MIVLSRGHGVINLSRGYGPLRTMPRGSKIVRRLNRSAKLPPVRSYEEARQVASFARQRDTEKQENER